MKKSHQILTYFFLFCLVLNIYNIFIFGNFYPSYLLWNLFLACIPYPIAIYFVSIAKYKKPKWGWIRGITIFVWLLFFPNTLYLLTDFVHLYEQTYLPVWFDIVQIFCLTFIGFIIGFLSLYKIEKVFTKRFGFNRSMIFIIASTVLASIGVYIGRNLRWNSWDLLIRPWQVIINFIDILSNTHNMANFAGMVLLFSGMFLGVYFTLRALVKTKEKEI